MDVDTSVTQPTQGKATQPKIATSKTPAVGKDPRGAVTPEKPVGQIALVLQGGGALGAYQAGPYQGLMEGGIEPDWVIGTSIGAINGALIAGNPPKQRVERLQEFWGRVGNRRGFDDAWSSAFFTGALANLHTITQGMAGFFQANPHAPWGLHFPVGIERAAFYTTEPLKRTLGDLVDFDHLNGRHTRLTVGAVSVRSGEMRYFDSRDMALGPAHIMGVRRAAAGLPGGTHRRRVLLGRRHLLEHAGRSRARRQAAPRLADHLRQHVAAHRLRARHHLAGARPAEGHPVCEPRQKPCNAAGADPSPAPCHPRARQSVLRRGAPEVRALLGYGCATTMHLVNLLSPRLDREDHTKDIDFTHAGIRTRWQAGYEHAQRVIVEQPWVCQVDPLQGVLIHESSEE